MSGDAPRSSTICRPTGVISCTRSKVLKPSPAIVPLHNTSR